MLKKIPNLKSGNNFDSDVHICKGLFLFLSQWHYYAIKLQKRRYCCYFVQRNVFWEHCLAYILKIDSMYSSPQKGIVLLRLTWKWLMHLSTMQAKQKVKYLCFRFGEGEWWLLDLDRLLLPTLSAKRLAISIKRK